GCSDVWCSELRLGWRRNRCASASICMQCILHQHSIGKEPATDQCGKYAGHRIRWPRNRCASASICMQCILHQYSIGKEAATDQCSKYAGHWIRCASDSVRLGQYLYAMHTSSVFVWNRAGN